MLFFRRRKTGQKLSFEMKKWINPQSEMIRKMIRIVIRISNKKIVTLQVRSPKYLDSKPEKRVSFSASASMTVEAAIALPLFLFAGCIMMQPFQILNTQRQVQEILEVTAEDISQNAGVVLNRLDMPELMTEAAAWSLAESAVRKNAQKLPLQNLSLKKSKLLQDGKSIDLIAEYEIRLPFSVFGLAAVHRINRSFRYAWTGISGAVDQKNPAASEEEEIVFVGRDSTRYHVSRSCHYLQPNLTAVAYTSVDTYRNKDGSRYKPCARCGDGPGSVVYISPYGEHYHANTGCSAITAYVRQVLKFQVEYLGACSYCSGKKGG